NGYSLVRHICFERAQVGLDARFPELRVSLGDELLRPTRIYTAVVRALPRGKVKGMAHITGGGVFSKLPRIFPSGCAARIDLGSWPVPGIFDLLQRLGDVSRDEMFRAFNMGIG